MNLELHDLQGEIWKDIKGYNGVYQVSNLGRVKSFRRTKTNIARIEILRSGYCRVLVGGATGGGGSRYLVHRLVAETFIPNPENKPCVNHINGIKTDNRLENLEWCTRSENIQHAISTGLRVDKKGDDLIRTRLTEKDVLEIVELIKNNIRKRDIAKMFNSGLSTIARIEKGETWSWLTGIENNLTKSLV